MNFCQLMIGLLEIINALSVPNWYTAINLVKFGAYITNNNDWHYYRKSIIE